MRTWKISGPVKGMPQILMATPLRAVSIRLACTTRPSPTGNKRYTPVVYQAYYPYIPLDEEHCTRHFKSNTYLAPINKPGLECPHWSEVMQERSNVSFLDR